MNLKATEELKSENISLKQQQTSIFKFQCDLCESPEYTALKCLKNREENKKDKMKLIKKNKVSESENIIEKRTTVSEEEEINLESK